VNQFVPLSYIHVRTTYLAAGCTCSVALFSQTKKNIFVRDRNSFAFITRRDGISHGEENLVLIFFSFLFATIKSREMVFHPWMTQCSDSETDHEQSFPSSLGR
jgi:hypothetical protein